VGRHILSPTGGSPAAFDLPKKNKKRQFMASGSGASPYKVTPMALRAVVVVALALLFWKFAPVLLLAFGGVLVAIFLRTIGDWVSKWTGLPAVWSLAIVLVLLGLLSAAGIYLSGDPVAKQMTELADQVPRSIEKISDDLKQFVWGKWLVEKVPTSAQDLPVSREDVASYASGALSSVTGGIVAALIVLVLSIYLSFDPDTYISGAIRLFPVRKRKRLLSVLKEVHETLQMWLLGKFLSMIVVGVLTSTGLWIIGVPLALALGVIAALLTFVPNFGPILSALPAILLAFVDAPMRAFYVFLLYFGIQTFESYLITPLIQQKTVSLPPALTISTQISLGILFGAGGIVFATPLTAAALVLLKRLYVEDMLEAEKMGME
jgi:predicted PurR-regulated permease PerM